eukprot:873756-Pelagomonas_calceolata.AAC.2
MALGSRHGKPHSCCTPRDGIVPPDEELAAWLQRVMPDPNQVVLVANKAEGAKARQSECAPCDEFCLMAQQSEHAPCNYFLSIGMAVCLSHDHHCSVSLSEVVCAL